MYGVNHLTADASEELADLFLRSMRITEDRWNRRFC
jgi:hypothetical protein